MTDLYTISYEPQTVHGEPGYWLRVYANHRLVMEGWSRGKRRNAEDMARAFIDRRDARRSA
jgi:hypothetical protein